MRENVGVDVVDGGRVEDWIRVLVIVVGVNVIREYVVEGGRVDGGIVREREVDVGGWCGVDGWGWEIMGVGVVWEVWDVGEVVEDGVNVVGVVGRERGIELGEVGVEG